MHVTAQEKVALWRLRRNHRPDNDNLSSSVKLGRYIGDTGANDSIHSERWKQLAELLVGASAQVAFETRGVSNNNAR
jgi:hypothetical protein